MYKGINMSELNANSLPKVRVRFAPSPTGWLHVGGARTALINYLFAKKHKGSFIVRVEDTDQVRGETHYLEKQLKDLQWLGLKWDEGPLLSDLSSFPSKGSYGPYWQSRRNTLYQQQVKKLLQSGKAYHCFLSEEEIQNQKKIANQNNQPFRVISPYRNQDLLLAQKKIDRGQNSVIRFKTPQKRKIYQFKDIVRGNISLPSDMIGDFILIRSSNLPVYNFSCAIDDFYMKITHVFRSEEHLTNTLRQMMIFESLGWKIPQYGHLSIIQDKDRKKLSKRHGASSCAEYKKQGYLPSAIINFLALLGWNPKTTQEVFSISELIKSFSTNGLHSAPAVFDVEKLKWINTQHIRQMDDMTLWNRLSPFIKKHNLLFPQSKKWQAQAIQSFKNSFTTLESAIETLSPLSINGFKIHSCAKQIWQWSSTLQVLNLWEKQLCALSCSTINLNTFSQILQTIQNQTRTKGRGLFMPLRTAVIGRPTGAELKLIVPLLSKQILLNRVRQLIKQNNSSNKLLEKNEVLDT